jgi:lysozyme family protein
MIETPDQVIDDILRREAGWSNRAADRGGPTMRGITLATLTRIRGRPVSLDELRALTEEEAREIYLAEYLTAPGFHKIRDPYVLSLAVDAGVNHGPARVIRWLQKIAGIVDDGIFGPVTEVAVNSCDPVRLFQKLLARRIEFYGELIAHDPQLIAARRAGFHLQAENALGWLRRASEFVEV